MIAGHPATADASDAPPPGSAIDVFKNGDFLRLWLSQAATQIGGNMVLFGLTVAILLGTFIGTYSSIYISAASLVWMGLKPDSFLRSADEKDEEGAVHPA